uniref:Uncharacterized protein n=1 Tax=Ditylenchus dipsaci TaxID=166011 RepID=A0A915D555_9BILA
MSDSPATKRSRRAKETFNPEYDEVVAWNSKQYAITSFIITSGQSVNLMGIRALSNFSILFGNFRLKLTRLAQRRPPRICYLKGYNEQVDR